MQQIDRARFSGGGQPQCRFAFGDDCFAVVTDDKRDAADPVRSGREHIEIEAIPGCRGYVHRDRLHRAEFEVECDMAFPHGSLSRSGGEADGESVDPLAAVLDISVEITRQNILKTIGLPDRHGTRRTVRAENHLLGQFRNQQLFSVNQDSLQRQRH